MDVMLLFWTFFVPALVALVVKGGLFLYAYAHKSVNRATRLYLFLLGAFSLQNVVVIAGYPAIAEGTIPYLESHLFYIGTIFAVALIFHLSLTLAHDRKGKLAGFVVKAAYLYALTLTLLILNTEWVIAGYEIVGHIITRVPGPLFFLVSIFLAGLLVASLAILFYGAIYQRVPQKRLKNQFLLAAMIPMAITIIIVLALFQVGVKTVNVSVLSPILITYFLVVTAYATYQHRLFDIQFYIPWSQVRKRKTAFYDRVRAMIAEIADLGSVNQAVERLADTLHCSVAFVDDSRTLLAAAGSREMAQIPLPALQRIDQILVANEIADAMPDTYAAMKRHGVAAVVPFYPHSKNAASWLLLGDSFSENVYTPLDFRVVEELFDKMSELFLDKLVQMRTRLTEAQSQILSLKTQLQTTEGSLLLVQKKIESLAQENARLQREQPADSLTVAERAPVPFTLTLLGRDKEILKRLRQTFPQAEQYAGVDSSSFRRQPVPDVLLVHVQPDTETNERKLLRTLTQSHRRCAILLYGERAADFAADFRQELVGLLAEVLPDHFTDEMLARKVRALAELRTNVHHAADPNHPLIGQSVVMKETLLEAKRLAGFTDPVFIKADDMYEALTLAAYMHAASGSQSALVALRTHELRDGATNYQPHLVDNVCERSRGGTLVIDDIDALPRERWEELLIKSNHFANCRLLVCGATETQLDPLSLMRPLRPFVLELPTLRERRADINLLVHYFTLQFNLQSAGGRYLSQAEVDSLLADGYPKDLPALKAAVFERLMTKETRDVTEPEIEVNPSGRTLDECVSEFEARLIADTLKRCGGNKSKAARLLGMRPNTLHYKLERYRLLDK